MPSERVANRTHVHSAYLLSLRDHWAYDRRVPGRNAEERASVARASARGATAAALVRQAHHVARG